MMKRALSIFLTGVFLLGLLPTSVLAAEGDVSYLYCDENGQDWRTGTKQSDEYTVVTATDATNGWGGSDVDKEYWYVVNSDVDVEFTQRVTVTGDVHLILTDGCNLTIDGGINAEGSNSLTIYGQQNGTGVLTAQNPGYANAGIGVGQDGKGGAVTINGGTVNATGGEYGAGIGGDWDGLGYTVTINGGTVNATGGYYGGGLNGGGGGNITINGGNVTATGDTWRAGIQCGTGQTLTINGGRVIATGGSYSAGIGGGRNGDGGTITINGGNVTANGDTGIGGGDSGSGGNITISGGTVTATSTGNGAGIGGGYFGSGVNITISGGDVTAEGNGGAGIGGGYGSSGGEITISGGNVTANSKYGAGIGGGDDRGSGGNITISGGKVIATSTSGGAGIGGGIRGDGGDFSTGVNGNAFITASSISDNGPDTKAGWSGIIFDGNAGYVGGNQSAPPDLEVKGGQTLTIPDGGKLTIGSNTTLTNNGTIQINQGGTLENKGTLTGSGTFTGDGEISGTKLTQTAPNAGEGYTIDCTTETIQIDAGYEVSSDRSSTITGGTIAPGTQFYVRKEGNNFYNASDWTDFTTPSRETAPSVSINYTNETLNTTAAMQYVIGASGHGVQSWTDCNANMAATAFGNWNGSTEVTVQFRTAATADKYASEAQSVKIPARPAAPVCQGQNESVNGKADGKISGTTTDMEYSTDGTNWTDCTDTETTGLAPGNYKVRLKATAAAFAGAAADVEIKSSAALEVTAPTFTAITYGGAQPTAQAITIRNIGDSDAAISSVTVSSSDFTISGSDTTVTAGGKLETYTIRPKDGLSAGEHTATITVTYNGGATATADVKFKVIGAAQAAPTDAPVEKSKTYNSVTLETVANNANGAAAEYSKDNGKTWQGSPEFTGLTSSTTYHFVVRYGASGNYEASPASPALEVTTEAAPVATYLVTVNGGTGGGSYAAGDTVTITATVPNGQRFTGWTVNTGGVTVPNTNPASFTMPAQAVTVTANFQSNSGGGNSGGGGGGYTPPTYPPTVEKPSGGGGTPSTSPSNPKQGDTVTVTPKPDEGYEVDNITVTDKNGKPVEVTKKPDGTYTFTQPTGKVKIEVIYKPTQPIDRPWNNPFTDVSEGDWFYEAVRFVQENGLMNGYSDGRFGANDTLSRAQLAQILFNKEGRPAVSGGGFNDVDSGAWYADAVTWAAENGIVGGYGNGTFGPNDPITREQLAVMLWRYSGSPAATDKELHFNDTDEISGFALEAMRWAVENGILNGYGDGRLGPQGQATRAQVAQMLKNFFEKG